MKKLVLLLALFAFTSCEKDEDFSCDCRFVKDATTRIVGTQQIIITGGSYPTDITDCNREGEITQAGFDLRCE
jgi:hypothetical protein